MSLELRPHLAKNEQGGPLFPDERSVWLGDQHIGYVGSPPGHAAMFINHWAGADPEIVEGVSKLIEKEFGTAPVRVTNVPPPKEADELEYEGIGED